METKYLIVGSGIAALSAAKQMRKLDREGDILLVSKEKMAPYYRVRLTEAIASDADVNSLLVEKPDFYEREHIRLMLNSAVTSIDYDRNAAALEDGTTIRYEKLLLAVGATPFIPSYEGARQANVFSVRTVEDLAALRRALPELRSALVVGGGLLGLEAAYSLLKKGLEVHVCEFAEHLLTRQLDAETAIRLEEDLAKEGLHIHVGASLRRINGFNRVESVVLTDGTEFSCDSVVFSVGIRPSAELAKDVLPTNRGILVDEHLQTERANVWAAGDCAEIQGTCMGLWSASNEMGKIVGENMAGGEAVYDRPRLFTNLRIGNVKVFSAGSHEGDDMWSAENDGAVEKLFFRDGRVIGGILYADTKKMGLVNKLIDREAKKEEAISEMQR